jgi:hypothetical protein
MSFLRGITKVGGNLDPKIFKQLDGLTDTAKLRKVDDLVAANPNLAKQLDGLDDAAKLKKLDELGDASKISKVDDLADAGSKAKKSTFLSRNASTLLAGGVAAGGLYYLDQQYANAKKETKDCMKVCLPENWDDHVYGDLKSSELIYKELDNPGEQPVCTAQIEDCGKYCGDKCEEIHDYDVPGSNLLTGAAEDAAEGASDLFTALFGDLFKDFGIDSTTMYASSSALSLCCCMMMVMMVVMK